MSRRWQTIERRRRSYYRQVERWVRAHLKERQEAALAALQPGDTPAQALGAAVQAGGSEAATRALLERVYLGVAVPFAREAWTALDEAGKAGAGEMVLKRDEPEDDWVRRVRQYLTGAGAEKVVQITDTTKAVIRRVLSQAVADGAGIEAMGRALREEMPGLSRSRAVMISRTEVIGASNRGALIGAQSTGMKLRKEWISTLGPRTRETHASADAQTVPMDQPFQVGGHALMHPGDGSLGAPASEIVNCRCAVGFLPAQ